MMCAYMCVCVSMYTHACTLAEARRTAMLGPLQEQQLRRHLSIPRSTFICKSVWLNWTESTTWFCLCDACLLLPHLSSQREMILSEAKCLQRALCLCRALCYCSEAQPVTSVSLELCPLYILMGIMFCTDTFNLSLSKRALTLGAFKLIWHLYLEQAQSPSTVSCS